MHKYYRGYLKERRLQESTVLVATTAQKRRRRKEDRHEGWKGRESRQPGDQGARNLSGRRNLVLQ